MVLRLLSAGEIGRQQPEVRRIIYAMPMANEPGDSGYYDEGWVASRVVAGEHRNIVGGMWDEVGELQFRWLFDQGMKPEHYLLDLACGSGRLAVKAVPYLNPGHYHGIDISPSLLDAARKELDALGLGDRINQRTFHSTADFKPPADFPLFDFIIAQSLFTHLRLPKFGQALQAVAGHLAPNGSFYATFFTAPRGTPERFHERGRVTTYADRDSYHYDVADICDEARQNGWTVRVFGDWNHPRDQQMFELTRPY